MHPSRMSRPTWPSTGTRSSGWRSAGMVGTSGTGVRLSWPPSTSTQRTIASASGPCWPIPSWTTWTTWHSSRCTCGCSRRMPARSGSTAVWASPRRANGRRSPSMATRFPRCAGRGSCRSLGNVASMVNLQLIDDWPVEHASAAVVSSDGSVLGTYGDQNRVYPLASVTKMLTAYAVLIAVEEEAVTLDEPAGPEGSTVRHLLAHASGLAMSEDKTLGQPGGRRVYSNIGFEYLAAHVAEQSGFRFAEYVQEGLVDPLGMADTVIEGSPAAGASSTVADRK